VPGVRAPHVWLLDVHGKRLSIVDLWGSHFTLVVVEQGANWRRAAAAYERHTKIPLSVVDVSDQGDYVPEGEKFRRLYGLDGACGMVVVRPDGFVARRFSGSADLEAERFLTTTFDNILGFSELDPKSHAQTAIGEADLVV
jgi:hypothetical protein